jgi:hypothetical protein
MSQREYSYPTERALVSLMSNGLESAASLTYNCQIARLLPRSIASRGASS